MTTLRHIFLTTLISSALPAAATWAQGPSTADHTPSLAPHKITTGTSVESYETPMPLVVDARNLPAQIVNMSTDVTVEPNTQNVAITPETQVTKLDLTEMDLVEDNPVFVGAYDKTEFDTIDAQRSMAGMPENLDADPLIPIGAVGIETDF